MPFFWKSVAAVEKDPQDVDNRIPKTTPFFVAATWKESLPATYVISVLSASNAELVTYPLDLIKTRLQIQGEGGSKGEHRGMLKTTMGVIKEEGFFKLWQGMLPMLYRHAVYSGSRLVIYDYLKETFAKADGKVPVWQSILFGCGSGAAAAWLSCPADLVKVQMQMEGRRKLMGEPARYTGANHAFADIVQKGGIKALWKGSVPNMQRAAMVTLGDITGYDVSKQMILKHTGLADTRFPCHFLAAACAGFLSTVLATPADVIKSRVMNQPTDDKGKGLLYRGSWDCLQQAIKKEGAFALYKGFLPCWIRLAPWAMTFWLTFEQIRHLIGAETY